jgi:hypothetical protein
MMWAAVARALPVLFAIYALQACAALVMALPAGLELVASAPVGFDAVARAEWLDMLLAWRVPARLTGLNALSIALVWLLLSPWLHMAWLSALSEPESLGTSLARGARLWLRATLVSCFVLLFASLAATPCLLAAWKLPALQAIRSDDRRHDLTVLLSLLPLAPVAALAHVWHDLARARALTQGWFSSTLQSLRDSLRITCLVSAGVWSGLGWSAVVASHCLSQRFASALVVQVALLQAGMLVRLVLRSRWLARTVACATAPRRAS